MNARYLAGAVAGSLVGGLGISAMMLDDERKSGKASEIVELQRTTAGKLGLDRLPADAPTTPAEAWVTHGGHLLLSALGGVLYAETVDESTPVLPGGIAFGLAFYAAAHGVTGPALGVKPPFWKQGTRSVASHAAVHVLFGLATALGARLALRR